MISGQLRPPKTPWTPLPPPTSNAGVLSFYFSDAFSRLPVRDVTRPGDNKSDPNLETKTFGLFSTCERQMRASVVSNSLRNVFFVTRRGGERVLTGYYSIAWYSESVLNGTKKDYALAADDVRFLADPIPLSKLPASIRDHALRPFRTFLRLDERQSAQLLELVSSCEDATECYLAEIDRLERLNKTYSGFRCWNRTEPFSWDDASGFLASSAVQRHQIQSVSNSSLTGWWRCQSCSKQIQNKSLLKQCPACGVSASLRPM